MTGSSRRQFLNAAGALMLGAGGLAPALSQTAGAPYPGRAFHSAAVDDILLRLFGTRDSGEDGSLRLNVPREAENRLVVPFRVDAGGADKIAVLALANRFPLACVADSANYPHGALLGVLKLEQSSIIACYAMKQGLLHHNSAPVRVAALG